MHRLLALLHTHGPFHMVYWSHVVSRYCPQYPGVESHVMDIFVLKVLVDDLRRQLLGATVSKVFQMSPDSILLRLWRGRDLRVFLSTHTTLQRLHLTAQRFANPPRPPRFAAFLRAHLHQTRLHDITVQPYDRVIHLTWERAGVDGPVSTLIHELLGPHGAIPNNS